MLLDWIPQRLFVALVTGGTLVTGIGFLDDHRTVPARVRASVHLIAALIALGMIGGLPSLYLGAFEVALGPVGWVLATLGIVWSIILYNFMDGIDGLASSEAVLVGGAGALLAWLTGSIRRAVASAIGAAAAAGFLVWNWAPARIFMGDAGSVLLGYCIAVTQSLLKLPVALRSSPGSCWGVCTSSTRR